MTHDDSASAPFIADTERASAVRDAAALWQRHLVDLGGRNSLLWKRVDGSVELDLTTAHPAGVAKLLSGRNVLLSEIVREPNALAHARQSALAIRDLAQELLEERGVISCFLAMGQASWDMHADIEAAAPILLRQCDIHPGGRYGDDLVLELSRTAELNSALATYMSSRGVNIDTEYVASLAQGPHGFDPMPTYDMIRRAGASIPGFFVSERLVISTFSYAKLSMVRDISDQIGWLHEHSVIAAMAGDESAQAEVAAQLNHSGLDVDPREEFLVLDADSHQQQAIEAVMAGQHLVLMGPPGTGKSQTIANLVATLAAHGRSALFVAEKRAAIDAVMGRLERLGLGNLILDAHTGTGTAADLVDGLARRLVTAPAPHIREALHSVSGEGAGLGDERESVVSTLEQERLTLLEHVRALHRIRDPFGVSAHDAQTHIVELKESAHPPRSRVRLEGETLQRIDDSAREEIGRTLVGLARRQAWRGDGKADPWFSTSVRGQEQMERTRALVGALAMGELKAHRDALNTVFAQAGMPEPQTMLEAGEVLDLIEHVHRSLDMFEPAVYTEHLPDYVVATAARADRAGSDQGLFERRRLAKEARATLRAGRQVNDLHAQLQRVAGFQQRWKELGASSQPNVPAEAVELVNRHEQLTSDLDWLGHRLETPTSIRDLLSMPFDDLAALLADLHANNDRLEVLPDVGGDLGRLRAQGLGSVVDDFAQRGLDDEQVRPEWEFIWWTSVLKRIRTVDPAYEAHRGSQLRQVVERFAEADRKHLEGAPERVLQRAYRRVDSVAEHFPEQVEAMEAALVFGHHVGSTDALRQAFAGAPDLMTSLAPCWAMSPLVVAQTIPPGQWFDVVIFDEASQIPPAEAISAISRGAQVVIAGDTQQLAPTAFVQRAADGDDTAHTGESILDVAAKLLPIQYLTWHYRSRDERLIAFSNEAVYRGELLTFPSALPQNPLRLHVVRGVEAADGWAAPAAGDEVASVVWLVRQHAAHRSDQSLGVITLGLTHARNIEKAVANAAAHDPYLAEFLARQGAEPFFVKNLERVQGDERDAIIFALGISPNSANSMVRRFGSLNHVGGERRLNVAITRSRHSLDVVAGFAGEDLDPSSLRSRGATMLRDFLLYVAEQDDTYDQPDVGEGLAIVGGKRRRAASTGSVALRRAGEHVEPFPVPAVVEDLADRLRTRGLEVEVGFGHSRSRIDLAIRDPRDPDRMLLAVESDGPQYAAMGSVRERDRLRAEQLRRLGWEHDRVWTVDLFRDPARDASRILDRVTQLTGMSFFWEGE